MHRGQNHLRYRKKKKTRFGYFYFINKYIFSLYASSSSLFVHLKEEKKMVLICFSQIYLYHYDSLSSFSTHECGLNFTAYSFASSIAKNFYFSYVLYKKNT